VFITKMATDSQAVKDAQIETVVTLEEPSDKNELLPNEKPCFTKRHLYIAIGLIFVIAISLIGSLLDFSPSNDGITEQSIREGQDATWPQFDTSNDGFIDQAEFTSWAANRIAARRNFVTADCPETVETTNSIADCNSTSTCKPSAAEVQTHFSPMDLNHDGKVTKDEALAWAFRIIAAIGDLLRGHSAPAKPALPSSNKMTPQACTTPDSLGFPGRVKKGWVGACKAGYQLSCYSSPFCQHHKKCHRSIITVEWTTTDTCCGSDQAANCTSCSCGGSYSFVPVGRNDRARALCHWLGTYHCGDGETDEDTHVPCW